MAETSLFDKLQYTVQSCVEICSKGQSLLVQCLYAGLPGLV